MDTLWLGVVGALAGGLLTFLGQTTVNRNSSLISLRVQKYDAYIEFLTSANQGFRLSKSLLNILEKQTKLNKNMKERTAQYKRILEEVVRIAEESGNSKLIKDTNKAISDAMNGVTTFPKSGASLPGDPRDKIIAKLDEHEAERLKLQNEYDYAAAKIPEIRSELIESTRNMDRTLVKMQLVAPWSIVVLGQMFIQSLHDWNSEKINELEVKNHFHALMLAAKSDLDHPALAKLFIYWKTRRTKKTAFVFFPNPN